MSVAQNKPKLTLRVRNSHHLGHENTTFQSVKTNKCKTYSNGGNLDFLVPPKPTRCGGISQDFLVMKLTIGRQDIEMFKQLDEMAKKANLNGLETCIENGKGFGNFNADICGSSVISTYDILKQCQDVLNQRSRGLDSGSKNKQIDKTAGKPGNHNDRKSVNRQQDYFNRRELIINSGIRRKVSSAMTPTFSGDDWPIKSPYACWNDCHYFDTPPVGVPEKYIKGTYYLYGNFCSYECAVRYLIPSTGDDDTLMMSCLDSTSTDSLSEKFQLLNTMCHEINPDLPDDFILQSAPPRLELKMFGGTKEIDEYRQSLTFNKKYTVFRPPMVPILYQIEESEDILMNDNCSDTRSQSCLSSKQDYIPIDKKRVELALKRRKLI